MDHVKNIITSYFTSSGYVSLHWAKFHFIGLCLHYIGPYLRFIGLCFTSSGYVSLHRAGLCFHFIGLCFSSLGYVSVHWAMFHFIGLCFSSLGYVSLHRAMSLVSGLTLTCMSLGSGYMCTTSTQGFAAGRGYSSGIYYVLLSCISAYFYLTVI